MKLPNAPLQEVIFELRWELERHENQQYDPDFDLAAGALHQLLKDDFSVVKKKVPANVPIEALPYQTIYQFWKGEAEWPVIQLGPGLLTVNETEENYEWESHYRPVVEDSLNKLKEAYGYWPLVKSAMLRYIDSVKVANYHFNDWFQFIRDHFNLNLENQFDTRGNLKSFYIQENFGLKEASDLQIILSNDKTKDGLEDVIIWQTAVYKEANLGIDDTMDWLTYAHDHTSSLFKEFLKQDFYDSFN